MSTSVVQEYYKVQNLWKNIDSDKKWKLAIWEIDFHDAEIISIFMGIEASPLGKFDDIFFHFTTEYTGDEDVFEKALYLEYLSWFDKPQKQEEDILLALRNDNLLVENYEPNKSLKPTLENHWSEMLRFKLCIKGVEKCHFCIYFQIPATDGEESTSFYKDALRRGIPNGIRLVTIDYADKRKVKLKPSSEIIILKPKLNMAEALQNEMSKGSFTNNAVGTEGRYRKLVLSILTLSQHGKSAKLDKEINQLLTVSLEMNSISAVIGSFLIASQAYFYVKDSDKCEYFADKAINESEKTMNSSDANLYPIWRGAVMLKAATYIGQQKRHKALDLYRKIAEEASNRADAFYIMEGYRLVGYLYYELGNLTDALESTLLALVGGSYLEKDVIRQSTFLQAANLAIHLAERTRSSDDVKTIEDQLKDWIGDDWESLVKNEAMNKSTIRHKASFIERMNAN